MPDQEKTPQPVNPKIVVRPNRCKCGCWSAREVHRYALDDGYVSVMYECVECGEYRL